MGETMTLRAFGLGFIEQVSKKVPGTPPVHLSVCLLTHCMPLLSAKDGAVFLDVTIEKRNLLAELAVVALPLPAALWGLFGFQKVSEAAVEVGDGVVRLDFRGSGCCNRYQCLCP